MLGDERIATFQTQTDDSPKTSDNDKLIYHISDHLNSSSLDLSSTGMVLQATDYLPFGKTNTYEVTSKRIQGKKGGYTNKYQFANKQLDSESDLQYFEKRYYDNRIGRFTTEDPVYWEVGTTFRPAVYFLDPQQWNSYSYVRNNPINYTDPTGELLGGDVWNPLGDLVEGGALLVGGAIVAGGVIAQGGALLKETYNAVVRSLSSTDSTHESTDKTNPQNNKSNQSEAGQEVTGQGQTQTQSQVATASPPPSGGGGKKDDGKNNNNTLSSNKGDIKLSDHALNQMKDRQVTKNQVLNTINKGEQFKYKDLQSGQIRIGYYDKINNIFVGKGDSVTTVIKPRGGQTYINNIKAR